MRLLVVAVALAWVSAVAAWPAAAPPALTWKQVAAGLRPALDVRSSNPCQRGDISCLDLVIAEMKRRDRRQAASCDHRALFTRLYLRTTEAFRAAAAAGRFHDRAAIVHFGAWFARLHFRAEDDWQAGRRADVPGAWQVAFEAAGGRSVRSMGDLLLGMNAHISRDLAYTVADVAGRSPATLYPDFTLFTTIIESKSVVALKELAARFDPALAAAVVPLELGGRGSLAALIGLWRSEAWANGIALADARGSARAAVARRIERTALLRADAIVAATAYLPVVQSSRARDAYCAAHAGP